MAFHHLLLHAANLLAEVILHVTLADTGTREVARRTARIAHRHGERPILVAVLRDACPVLRMIGHIVLGVVGRAVGLGIGVDAEHGEVARLAGPHPVVGLSAKLAYRLGHGEHQAQVAEVAIGGGIVAVALIERQEFHAQGGVLFLGLTRHSVLDGIEENGAAGLGHLLKGRCQDLAGHVLLLHHERDKHVLVGQFLLKGLGIEAVQHVVMLHGAVRADGLEAAVVVGEHQSVGAYDHARAIAREVDDALHNGIVGLVQLFVGQLVALLLHHLVHRVRQVVERPHAFIGLGSKRSKACQ